MGAEASGHARAVYGLLANSARDVNFALRQPTKATVGNLLGFIDRMIFRWRALVFCVCVCVCEGGDKSNI